MVHCFKCGATYRYDPNTSHACDAPARARTTRGDDIANRLATLEFEARSRLGALERRMLALEARRRTVAENSVRRPPQSLQMTRRRPAKGKNSKPPFDRRPITPGTCAPGGNGARPRRCSERKVGDDRQGPRSRRAAKNLSRKSRGGSTRSRDEPVFTPAPVGPLAVEASCACQGLCARMDCSSGASGDHSLAFRCAWSA
jgi:hypothetical protein